MLAQLLIRNFAIIDQTELELSTGVTALTGETGAGKSILLDALGLVLGDRADTDSIRESANKAEITAVFHPAPESPIWRWLEEQDLDQADECILRRIVSRENRSRAYINGSPVALQTIRTAGELLVNIHGQHEHQSLSHSDYQRQLLDAYGENRDLLNALYSAYKEWEKANSLYQQAQTRLSRREQRTDLLRFQAQELDALELDARELVEIESEHRRIANSGQLHDLATQSIDHLYENEDSVYSQLSDLEHGLQKLADLDEQAVEFLEMVRSAAIQCSESAAGLRNYLGHIEADPQRLQWLEDRMSSLDHMARKHNVAIEELIEVSDAIHDELDEIENSGLTLENLDKLRMEKEADYYKVADRLTRRRRNAAKSMSKAITEAMQNLAMRGGVFDVAVSKKSLSRPAVYGQDEIHFLVSANPGQKPRPLGKVASGGELSRISLAIQLIAAQHKVVESMIFDEVDSGIGGAVAETVGRYLRQLAGNCQILCVTHLPQVAAQAHHHFRVVKSSDGSSTETELIPLSRGDKVEEIARMLGGHKITRQTLRHAREMLEGAGL